MILIFSESNDLSTINVIDWLKFRYKREFIRVNTDIPTNISINSFSDFLSSNYITYGDILFSIESIKTVWFRRGFVNFHFNNPQQINGELGNQIYNFLKVENQVLSDYISFMLTQKVSIGGLLQNVNKLHILQIAKNIGLSTPETIVTESKELLIKFFKKYKKIITKPLYTLSIKTFDKLFLAYTSRIDEVLINKLPDKFFYSLFQSEISKQYEVRVFYFKGEFYSMAIFSQNDKQTEVDFRKYNKTKPNRCVPYKLPNKIEFLLDRLMKKINLDNASIDIIVNKKGEYFFLEINPVGQFGMVSMPCNYFLERKIAEYLSI